MIYFQIFFSQILGIDSVKNKLQEQAKKRNLTPVSTWASREHNVIKSARGHYDVDVQMRGRSMKDGIDGNVHCYNTSIRLSQNKNRWNKARFIEGGMS